MTEQSRDRIAPGRGRAAPKPGGREQRDRFQARRSAQQRRATTQAVSDPNEIRGGNGLLRRVLRRAERSGAEYRGRSRREPEALRRRGASAEERSGDGATLRDHPALDAG